MLKKVINFVIDENVKDKDQLISLYFEYHKKFICTKWTYKRLRRKKFALELSSNVEIVLGGLLAIFTEAVTLSISSVGLITRLYLVQSNISRKIHELEIARNLQGKILVDIQSYLTGAIYNPDIVFSDITLISSIINSLSIDLNGSSLKYDRTYSNVL